MLEKLKISLAGRLTRFPRLQERVAIGLLDDRGILTKQARRRIQDGLQSQYPAIVHRTSRAHAVAAFAGEARRDAR